MDELQKNIPPVLPQDETPAESDGLFPPLAAPAAVPVQASETPLHDAAMDGDVKKLRACLDLGMDINAQNENGNTALHVAAREGHADAVKFLRAREGIDENIENKFGLTPAAYAQDEKIKVIFARQKPSHRFRSVPRQKSLPERTILEWVEGDGMVIISFIALMGALVTFSAFAAGGFMVGMGALVPLAVFLAPVVAAMHFLKKHEDDAKLMQASQNFKVETVDALLRKGVNPNGHGLGFPLCEAVKWGNPVVTLSDGSCVDGGRMIVERLLEYGADPNVAGPDGRSPLAIAVEKKEGGFVSALLEHGANPNVRDGEGKSLLFSALPPGNEWIASRLLEYGADPNVRDAEGYTPLFRAVLARNRELVAILRSCTDPTLPNNEGQTVETYLELVDGKKPKKALAGEFGKEAHEDDAAPEKAAPPRKPAKGPGLDMK